MSQLTQVKAKKGISPDLGQECFLNISQQSHKVSITSPFHKQGNWGLDRFWTILSRFSYREMGKRSCCLQFCGILQIEEWKPSDKREECVKNEYLFEYTKYTIWKTGGRETCVLRRCNTARQCRGFCISYSFWGHFRCNSNFISLRENPIENHSTSF